MAKKKKTARRRALKRGATPARRGPAKRRPAAKPARRKKAAAKATRPKKKAPRAGARPPARAAGKGLTAGDKRAFRHLLLALREHVTGQIHSLKNDSLTRQDAPSTEEDGTDAFDRQFALSLASSDNEALFEIDEALARLDEGRYGICEVCGLAIEKPRLQALPFVRNCVKCQSELEKRIPKAGHPAANDSSPS